MRELAKKYYNIGTRNKHFSFATFPDIKVYKESTGKQWSNHLLFGDYIEIKSLDVVNNRVKAKSRNTIGWVNVTDLQKQKILEVNFVDIGQGDGCHVVTPNGDQIIIDAGETDNMNRYLTWRFNLYNKTKPLSFPFTSIISHSDKDHYFGFQHIFKNKNIKFSRVYHNGLVERPGRKPMGKEKNNHFVELVQNTSQMSTLISKTDNRKGTRSTYCKTLFAGLEANPNIEFKSLSTKDGYLEDYPEDNKINRKEFSVEILGPITKRVGGKDALKTISNLGKDKNGHSVILRITYGKATILLGGDVNTEFGEILHKHYKRRGLLDKLKVDVAKACHHGSNHFHYGFLEAINAAATVISSGDNESYGHPRPDTIGALGKCGYGEKPLVFSTELARSNKEMTFKKLEIVAKLFDTLKAQKSEIKKLLDAGEARDSALVKKIKKNIVKTNQKINSFSTKFGMINLRTDGNKMILAQKYESSSAHGKWDIHALTYSRRSKRFELVKKH